MKNTRAAATRPAAALAAAKSRTNQCYIDKEVEKLRQIQVHGLYNPHSVGLSNPYAMQLVHELTTSAEIKQPQRSDDGACLIVVKDWTFALRYSTVLTSLNVSDTKFSDTLFYNLFNALSANTTLVKLNLDHTGLADRHLKRLLPILKTKIMLFEFSFGHNRSITDASYELILDYLEETSTLGKVYMKSRSKSYFRGPRWDFKRELMFNTYYSDLKFWAFGHESYSSDSVSIFDPSDHHNGSKESIESYRPGYQRRAMIMYSLSRADLHLHLDALISTDLVYFHALTIRSTHMGKTLPYDKLAKFKGLRNLRLINCGLKSFASTVEQAIAEEVEDHNNNNNNNNHKHKHKKKK
jgi:hypothetical protein